jgi:hypothetical protein
MAPVIKKRLGFKAVSRSGKIDRTAQDPMSVNHHHFIVGDSLHY